MNRGRCDVALPLPARRSWELCPADHDPTGNGDAQCAANRGGRAIPTDCTGRRLHGRRAGGDGVLTPHQRETLRLVANGYANKAIALRLGLREQDVKNRLTRAYARLGLRGNGARTPAAIRLLDTECPGWRGAR